MNVLFFFYSKSQTDESKGQEESTEAVQGAEDHRGLRGLFNCWKPVEAPAEKSGAKKSVEAPAEKSETKRSVEVPAEKSETERSVEATAEKSETKR